MKFIRTLLKRLSGQGDPVSLTEEQNKLLSNLLYEQEFNGEKAVNRSSILCSIIASIIIAINIPLSNFHIKAANALLGSIVLLVYHICLYILLRYKIYKIFFKYITSTVHILIGYLLIMLSAVDASIVDPLRTHNLLLLPFMISLSGLYFNPKVPIYTSFLSASLYTLIFLYAYFFTDARFVDIESFKGPTLSNSNLISFTSLNLLCGFFISFLTIKLKKLVMRSLNAESLAHSHEREKKELKELTMIKTNFFINIAHETKTPLTLISNYLDEYINNHGTSVEIGIIKQNIDKLKRDMLNFLDAEKLERNQIFYNHELLTDVSELLSNKLDLFTIIADKKNLDISHKITPGIVVKADPAGIDRITNNLIDNAIKYTHNGGAIKILLERKDDMMVLTVSDNGPGIPSGEQKNIFKAYRQVSQKKRNTQGIGMGLYIVSMIVEGLAGNIDVESEPGKGTLFTVRLPVFTSRSRTLQRKEYTVAAPVDTINKEVNIPEPVYDATKNTILIVEDNVQLLKFSHSHFMTRYNVYTALNGKEALEKLAKIPRPDCIISDVMMDVMDGISMLNVLYTQKEYREIPVLFTTAKSTLTDKLTALNYGAIDYIAKPFNVEELKAKVASIIDIRNFKSALYERDKFTTLGLLSGGFCHEIGNPLQLIYGYLDILIEEAQNVSSDPEVTGKYLEKIALQIKRIESIVVSLKHISQDVCTDKKLIDPLKIIDSIKNMFGSSIGERITFKTHLDSDISIHENEDIITRVLLNLISNAIDAIDDEGEITVSFFIRDERMFFEVADTGCGIDKDKTGLIFNAFYSDKESSSHPGLGLTIVQEIVHKMDWKIFVDSKAGTGTTFIIDMGEI